MPLVQIAKAGTSHVETFPPPLISSLARHLRASGSAGGSLSMLVRCLLNWFIPVLLLALWQGLYIYIYIYKKDCNQTTNSSHYLYLCKHAFLADSWNDGLFLHILYEGCRSQQVSWRQTLQSNHLSETTAWFTDSCLESFAEMSPVQLNMQRKRGVCHVIEKQMKQIHWVSRAFNQKKQVLLLYSFSNPESKHRRPQAPNVIYLFCNKLLDSHTYWCHAWDENLFPASCQIHQYTVMRSFIHWAAEAKRMCLIWDMGNAVSQTEGKPPPPESFSKIQQPGALQHLHDTHGGTEPCFSLMVQAVAPKCVMLLVFCMRPWTIPQDSSQCSLPWSSESDGSHGHDASWASCKKFLPNSLTCQRTVSCTTWSNAAMYLCSAVYVSKYVDLDRKTLEMLNHTWQPLKVKRSSGHEADRNGILLWANVDNRSKVDHSFYRCLGKTMFVSL